MIKFENIDVVGFQPAIRGMRNPMNSWDKSDTHYYEDFDVDLCVTRRLLDIGPNDRALMMKLAKGGPVHAKYRRMIMVYVDITAPLYWWKEFDTYKVGTVANSCSTMHKIHEKEFTLEDFSYDHIDDIWSYPPEDRIDFAPTIDFDVVAERTTNYVLGPVDIVKLTIAMLNRCRELYLKTGDKKYWWQMIQLLPSSYNQRRTVMMSYEVLANVWQTRHDHKLDEWRVGFMDFIKDLPLSEIITGEETTCLTSES